MTMQNTVLVDINIRIKVDSNTGKGILSYFLLQDRQYWTF